MESSDHRRFLELYLAEQDILRGFVRAAVGGRPVADELFQEVSGVLWEAFPRYDAARPFRSWALGVARLEIVKWRQRTARRREVADDRLVDLLAEAAEAADGGDGAQRERLLARCLDGLAAPLRDLLRRRYGDGAEIADIAAATKRSVAAVEMALVRGRRALRTCVERGLAQEAG